MIVHLITCIYAKLLLHNSLFDRWLKPLFDPSLHLNTKQALNIKEGRFSPLNYLLRVSISLNTLNPVSLSALPE